MSSISAMEEIHQIIPARQFFMPELPMLAPVKRKSHNHKSHKRKRSRSDIIQQAAVEEDAKAPQFPELSTAMIKFEQ